jgi:uncharacterized protein DUF4190
MTTPHGQGDWQYGAAQPDWQHGAGQPQGQPSQPFASQPFPSQPQAGQSYVEPPISGMPYNGPPPVEVQPLHTGTQPYYQPAQYQPGPYQQPYPYQPYGPPRPTNGLAVASMVLGILWVYWIGSILALVFGYVARDQIRRSGQGGDGMAVAGIVLGWIGVGFLILGMVFWSSFWF